MYWSCYRGEETESREYYALFTLSQKAEKRKEKQKEEEGFCFYDRLLFFFFFYLPSTEAMGSPRCAGIKKKSLGSSSSSCNCRRYRHIIATKIYKQKQKQRVGLIKKNTVKKRLKFKYEKNIIMMFQVGYNAIRDFRVFPIASERMVGCI